MTDFLIKSTAENYFQVLIILPFTENKIMALTRLLKKLWQNCFLFFSHNTFYPIEKRSKHVSRIHFVSLNFAESKIKSSGKEITQCSKYFQSDTNKPQGYSAAFAVLIKLSFLNIDNKLLIRHLAMSRISQEQH